MAQKLPVRRQIILAVRVPKPLRERFVAEAERRGVSLSDVAREALERGAAADPKPDHEAA